jgi:UDP-4-amino-4,6-dideoxy-N-acetyl-beta-L-altrosamine transaminase
MTPALAIDGGHPIRATMLRYSTQAIDDTDRQAIDEVLRGEWLTTGPYVGRFENALCQLTGAAHAVAVNTGTAALHAAVDAVGIGQGDEVIVPAISFVASSNCVLYKAGTPVFADVEADTLNIDPADVARKISPRTRAIVAVDFAGHPCDHDALHELAASQGIPIIEDAAHSLGASYRGRQVGTLQDLTTLSFHPVKHITTGEGGAVLTAAPELAKRVRSFRHHGVDLDLHARATVNTWEYDVITLGYNFRLPDINCALGLSQMKRLPRWLQRRRDIVSIYAERLGHHEMLQLPTERPNCGSAWHLYVVRLNLASLRATRAQIFAAFRAENIGVNVHYIPIPWMSLYRDLGYRRGEWATAEREYERILSLPLYPGMTDADIDDVVQAVEKIWQNYRR